MKSILILSFVLAFTASVNASKFEGTFTMHSEPAKNSPVKDKPSDAKFTVKNELIAIEPVGKIPGAPGKYRVLFNSGNQTTTMLMDNNGQKQGFRRVTDPANMPPDMRPDNDAQITPTKEVRTIEGYKCHKVIIEGGRNRTEAWMTDQTGLNISEIAGAFMAGRGPATGMAGISVPNKLTGFPIEMTVYDKERKSTTIMHFGNFHKGPVDPLAFSTEGYNIIEVPGAATPPMMPEGPGGMPPGQQDPNNIQQNSRPTQQGNVPPQRTRPAPVPMK